MSRPWSRAERAPRVRRARLGTLRARVAASAVAAGCLVLALGCASAWKAYDERLGWLVEGKPPTIRFGCAAKPPARAVDWRGADPISVFVPGIADALGAASAAGVVGTAGVAGSGARLAGDLIRWRMGNGAPLAVNVEGPPPEQVLVKDVVDLMARSGFLVVGAPVLGVLTLTAAMTAVNVEAVPGDWLNRSGKTEAAVDFAVKLASGEASKELKFTGEHAFSMLSAVASSPESTVNAAYCDGLRKFAEAVAEPGVLGEMRGVLGQGAAAAATPAGAS